MQAFAEQLTAQHGVNLSEVGAHLRLDLPGFDRLCIERLTDYAVSVAHYFAVNGDLVPEPDIVFHTGQPEGWIPIEVTQSIMGFMQLVTGGFLSPIVAGSETLELDGVAVFAELWAGNLADQGWFERGIKHVYLDYHPVEDFPF